jgi:hypothetical protein
MAINLLSLEPHKVSRDLSGYITYVYGIPKVGKTTFGAQFPGALILAFERGYNALPGVIAQDITTWGEFKQVLRELKKPEVQAVYKSIIIDTVDIAASLCEKYICNQLGIENIGDGGWSTNGWSKYKKEFEDSFRTITQLGYAVCFISHSADKTFKRKDGTEYNQMVPTAQRSVNEIVKGMADIFACADIVNGERKLILRSLDGSVDTGCRFKYIESEIPFSYDALVEALNKAIDKEAAETNNKFVTNDRVSEVIAPTYDYDALMVEFQQLTGNLMRENPGYGPKITEIVERYLGKGKKVSETTRDQAEFVDLIVSEIKSELVK